jgi:hypothetical protein
MTNISKLVLAGFIAFLVILTIPKPAYSGIGTFTFRKVADTNTPIPGGVGNFLSFTVPSIDFGDVAFFGNGLSGQGGVYISSGGTLNVVVDTSTPIPGGTGNFTSFGFPSLDAGIVAFFGRGSPGQEGVYLSSGDTLEVVADLSTPIPGGTGNFTIFGFPLLDAGIVAFIGHGSSGQEGVYISSRGTLNVVADKSTPIPGGTGSFSHFISPAVGDGKVVFVGTGGPGGIYISSGDILEDVVDGNTPIPGGSGTSFAAFGPPSFDGESVAFVGTNLTFPIQEGVYLSSGDTLEVVADLSTPIPGGTGNFEGFGVVSVDGDNVAFEGDDGSEEGIFIDIGGVLMKVINPGDSLDGKTVSSDILFSKEGLSGNSVVFFAAFTDGSRGIFVAELVSPPPPSPPPPSPPTPTPISGGTPTPSPPPSPTGGGGTSSTSSSGGCTVAEAPQLGSTMANILILSVPAFAVGLRMIRRRNKNTI